MKKCDIVPGDAPGSDDLAARLALAARRAADTGSIVIL